MSDTNTLAGRPITGEIHRYSRTERVDQRPIEELLAALDAMFVFPEVEAVRWTQYTPYFNDGDVCEFGTGEIYVKWVGQDDGGDYEDGFYDKGGDFPPGYWDTHYRPWVRAEPGLLPGSFDDRVYGPAGTHRPDIKIAHKNLGALFYSGAFEDQLRESFGDPAEVTATRDGFHVEFYEHD
ncbi:hypothetical protein [Nocardia sp. NPDC127526]|uniref:hypothetical protein n=1 Tax=Nocardia sp. NPDC127526 TaxID=3345393 RepID=UPI0036323152